VVPLPRPCRISLAVNELDLLGSSERAAFRGLDQSTARTIV